MANLSIIGIIIIMLLILFGIAIIGSIVALILFLIKRNKKKK